MNSYLSKRHIFDAWANSYDFIFPAIFYQATHKRMLDYIKLTTYPYVLDIGCGTGRLLQRFSNKYPDMKGIGLDFSSEMLTRARQVNRINPNLIFIQGKSYPLRFISSYFSDIFNTFSFLHYENPYQFFQEVYRVLIPGGKFYLVDPIISENIDELKLPITPKGISIYSSRKRESIGFEIGFTNVEHFLLLGTAKLSIFEKPS